MVVHRTTASVFLVVRRLFRLSRAHGQPKFRTLVISHYFLFVFRFTSSPFSITVDVVGQSYNPKALMPLKTQSRPKPKQEVKVTSSDKWTVRFNKKVRLIFPFVITSVLRRQCLLKHWEKGITCILFWRYFYSNHNYGILYLLYVAVLRNHSEVGSIDCDIKYSQKKTWISTVFYCSVNPSIPHDLWTTGPIQMGFSAKCTSLSEHFDPK